MQERCDIVQLCIDVNVTQHASCCWMLLPRVGYTAPYVPIAPARQPHLPPRPAQQRESLASLSVRDA